MPQPTPALPRTLGVWTATGIVIGITIGSGIFRSPAAVADRVPNPMLILGLWALGGAISLCGALSFAELAATLPHTGGYYTYLREGWGRLTGFLYGWSQLVLIRGASVGGIAIVFGEYFLRTLGIDPITHGVAAKGVSAAAIALAAAVNILGINLGAAIVGVSTIGKFAALLVIVAAAAWLGPERGATLANVTQAAPSPVDASSLGLALISVLWAYDGFADVSMVAG